MSRIEELKQQLAEEWSDEVYAEFVMETTQIPEIIRHTGYEPHELLDGYILYYYRFDADNNIKMAHTVCVKLGGEREMATRIEQLPDFLRWCTKEDRAVLCRALNEMVYRANMQMIVKEK